MNFSCMRVQSPLLNESFGTKRTLERFLFLSKNSMKFSPFPDGLLFGCDIIPTNRGGMKSQIISGSIPFPTLGTKKCFRFLMLVLMRANGIGFSEDPATELARISFMEAEMMLKLEQTSPEDLSTIATGALGLFSLQKGTIKSEIINLLRLSLTNFSDVQLSR